MLERNKSCIINLSSISSYFTMHGGAGYCSSKLYDDFLSRALAYEYRKKIDILSVKPNFVSTPLTRNMRGLLVVNKNECAGGSLKALGNSDETFGHWLHHIEGYILSSIPQ